MYIATTYGRDLPPSQKSELYRYRHRIFVRELGWSLPAHGMFPDCERDQFDSEDTVYVIGWDVSGEICGCARLLPTIKPYLLGDVFPSLAAPSALPRSGAVWELSRFAARGSSGREQRACNPARSIFAHALLAAQERGAEQVIGVLSPAVERVCRILGAHLVRMGGVQTAGQERVVACAIELEREGALLALARREREAQSATRAMAQHWSGILDAERGVTEDDARTGGRGRPPSIPWDGKIGRGPLSPVHDCPRGRGPRGRTVRRERLGA